MSPFPLQAGISDWAFGFYSGWSFGTGYGFKWHERPYLSDKADLGFQIGGYARWDLHSQFGLRLDFNYQTGKREFIYTGYTPPSHDEWTENFDILTLTLLLVLQNHRTGPVQFYLMGGCGGSTGEWGELSEFEGIYLNLTAGPGVRIFLSRSSSGPALIIEGTYHYLFEFASLSQGSAEYLRLNIGIEF